MEHPSIMFANYEYKEGTNKVWGIRILVWFFHRVVKKQLLNRERATKMLLKLGMPKYFSNYPSYLLKGNDNWNIVRYQVPKKNERIAIYTVMTGDYDDIKTPLYESVNCDYFLFTNNANIVEVKGWKVIHIKESIGNLLLSRKVKMLPHMYLPTEYEVSVYVDASVLIWGNIVELTHYLNKDISFAVTKHSVRNKVIDELNVCYEYNIINKQAYNQALKRYDEFTKEGFKDDMGLAECGILIRRHSDRDLQKLMEMWWYEFQNGCGRDQIYLMPVIHKMKFKSYRLIDGFVFSNQFCVVEGHNKERK
ncbi:MAG: DUF616 domain-containing protein [Paludibacteraceae bacterium]|nr:DUF616 domain-containing protein [Paludibacteraceae bacterium]